MAFFAILLFLCYAMFPCDGKIISPSNGDKFIFLPNSNGSLIWKFDDDISKVRTVNWYFMANGRTISVPCASIRYDDTDHSKLEPRIEKCGTCDGVHVDVREPTTLVLVLKNVNQSCNGTYKFQLHGQLKMNLHDTVNVHVFIATKPNVTINCSDPTTVNETNDLICVCESEGGNPPANVTWYDKDGIRIGKARYGENILTLTKVTEQTSGRYTCKAQSFTLVTAKPIEIKVNYKPNKIDIKVPEEVYVGETFIITCDSNGLPTPNFTITHNVTNIVSNDSMYTKINVQYGDAGIYECIAKNLLGNISDSGNLTVKAKRPATKTPKPTQPLTPPPRTTKSKMSEPPVDKDKDSDDGLRTGAIAGIIVGVLLLVVVIVVIVIYFCKK